MWDKRWYTIVSRFPSIECSRSFEKNLITMNPSKLLLIALWVVALMSGIVAQRYPEVVCEHNAIYMERCNICICSKDGFSTQCTTFVCDKAPNGYEISQGPPSWGKDES